jgi:hypothetical protein
MGRGGRCEIRTHGAVADTPDFKSGALDHSANLPQATSALNFRRLRLDLPADGAILAASATPFRRVRPLKIGVVLLV